MSNNFDELLKSLSDAADQTETLAKADAPVATDDDETVAAAAADSGVAVPGAAGDDDEEEAEGGEMTKSEGLVDATELVKSIMDRQDSTDGVLAKALGSFTAALSSQNTLIKSLQTQVAALSGQGRGRKAVVSVVDKPGVGEQLAKSDAAKEGVITPGELLAKSDAAYKGGAISGSEFNTVDVCLRHGWAIDTGILAKVAAASA